MVDGKTFLVAGGAGFLGSWFCDTLNTLNARIICVDNLLSGSDDNISHLKKDAFQLVKSDIISYKPTEKIDYIVNMACIASPPLYQKHPIQTLDASVLGTRNLLEIARKNDIEGFLLSSTSEIYGDATIIPTPEDYWGNVNPIGPRSIYDEGKRVAETYSLSYCQKYGLPVRIARIFNTYGPRLDTKSTNQYGRVIVKFIDQALKSESITVYGDGRQTRSFCYITDQIVGLFKLLLRQGIDGQVVNLGNDDERTILELAKFIIKLTNSKSEITFQSLPKDDPKRRRPDIRKAEELLEWQPKVSLEEGLTKTVAYTKH
ncbi:MAG: UDP-glucuronate decarboxylase [Thermoproteota archaeon]|nr:UDP-glucuronate decarboxylase [Thermoproteota archaeon]